MDDQQDDKLKQRVKEVFDNYADTSADESWLLLREKFPEKKRRRAVLWLWSAAAVLLLAIGLGMRLYLNRKPVDGKRMSNRVKTIRPSKPEFIQEKPVVASPQKVAEASDMTKSTMPVKTSHHANTIQTKTTPLVASSAPDQNSLIAAQVGVDHPQHTIHQQKNQVSTNATDSTAKSSAKNSSAAIANTQQKNAENDTSAKQVIAANPKPNKNINDLFAADKDKTSDDRKIKPVNKVLFGVYAATYFNYAKGSANQVNAGAGFTADIPLSSNLKLVTGLSINQNSFVYNNGGDQGFPPAAVFGAGGSSSSTSTTDYTQNASLLGLDIPLNLKYIFNLRKNQVYVLAGVGSGTFINQSYAYLNPDGSTAAAASSGKGFNDFYFARTLNMALGLGYPLGNNQIVIEPFVKYPLQGLGAQQLRFGASGINLKFNFSIKK